MLILAWLFLASLKVEIICRIFCTIHLFKIRFNLRFVSYICVKR